MLSLSFVVYGTKWNESLTTLMQMMTFSAWKDHVTLVAIRWRCWISRVVNANSQKPKWIYSHPLKWVIRRRKKTHTMWTSVPEWKSCPDLYMNEYSPSMKHISRIPLCFYDRSAPVNKTSQCSPLNAAKSVLVPLLGLNLKVKRTCCGGASGKVDTRDLFKAQVNRGLVDVDETPFQRIEEAWGCLVGAGDALGSWVSEEEEINAQRVTQLYLILQKTKKKKCFWKTEVYEMPTLGSFQVLWFYGWPRPSSPCSPSHKEILTWTYWVYPQNDAPHLLCDTHGKEQSLKP